MKCEHTWNTFYLICNSFHTNGKLSRKSILYKLRKLYLKTRSHVNLHLKCAWEAIRDNFYYFYRNPKLLTARFFVLLESPGLSMGSICSLDRSSLPVSSFLTQFQEKEYRWTLQKSTSASIRNFCKHLWSYLILFKFGSNITKTSPLPLFPHPPSPPKKRKY